MSGPVISADQCASAIRAGAWPVRGATVRGSRLDLRGVHLPHGLRLRDVTFACAVDLTDARADRSVDLSNCTFQEGLWLDDARIEGSLGLERVVVGELDPNAEVDEQGRPPFRSRAESLSMRRARVEGQVWAIGLRVAADLELLDASIASGVHLNGTEIRGRLFGQGCSIAGNFFCHPEGNHRTEITGDAWLAGAAIEGQADFNGASIGGELNMQGARVSGGLFCRPVGNHRTEIAGDAYLAAATIEGAADFNGASIGRTLNMQGARVSGGLFCRPVGNHRTEITGDAHLAGATIEGAADFNGASIGGRLNMQGARVSGGFFCCPEGNHRTEIAGDAHLAGATIEGQANFSGASIRGRLIMQGARVSGGLLCRPEGEHRTEITGDAHLASAAIEGQVEFDGASIGGELNMQVASVAGSLVLEAALVDPSGRCIPCLVRGGVHAPGLDAVAIRATGLSAGRIHYAGRMTHRSVDLGNANIRENVRFWARGIPHRIEHNQRSREQQASEAQSNAHEEDLAACIPRASLEGDLDLKNATIAGDVNLARLDVRGVINLADASLGELWAGRPQAANEDEYLGDERLSCRMIRIDGMRARGDVELSWLKVGPRETSQTEANGRSPPEGEPADRPRSLDARNAEIAGDLKLANWKIAPGACSFFADRIDLSNASAAALWITGRCTQKPECDQPREDARGGRGSGLGWRLRQAGRAKRWLLDRWLSMVRFGLGLRRADLVQAARGESAAASQDRSDAGDERSRQGRIGRFVKGAAKRLLPPESAAFVERGQWKKAVAHPLARWCRTDEFYTIDEQRISLERTRFRRVLVNHPLPRGLDLANLSVDRWDPPTDYRRDKFFEELLDGAEPFSAASYGGIERTLRDRGERAIANRIHRRGARRNRWTDRGRLRIAVFWLIDLLTGYGTGFGRLLLAGLFFFVVSSGLVFHHPENIVATAEARGANDLYIPREAHPGDPRIVTQPAPDGPGDGGDPKAKAEQPVAGNPWGWGSSVWMTLRHQIPVVNLVVRNEWKPADTPIRIGWSDEGSVQWSWLSAEDYANVVLLIHWIIVPVLLLSAGGFFRRRT